MQVIGRVQGAGNRYDDPGWAELRVTDEWDIELIVQGQDGGPTAKVIVAFEQGFNSATAMALLCLQAERHVGELVAQRARAWA